jgi:glycosyltransferase involved in cell wall biosynthesis
MGAAALSHCRLFAENGWQVSLAAPGAIDQATDGVRGHDLDIPEGAFHIRPMLVAALQARRLMRELKPDVSHVHGLRTFGVMLAAGRRPFVTLHGGGRNPGQTYLGTWIRERSRSLAPLAARGAFSVVPLERGRWTTLLMPSPRLGALQNVVDEAVAKDPLFIFVARLAPPKRPEFFVDAMALLQERVPSARGVVLGEGPGRVALEARIQETGAPVRLVGQVEEMTQWYRQAWGVCLLSDFEALPFVVQEAMWAGRPVITSPLSGIEWFAADTARYVRKLSDVVEALFELCDPLTRESRGRAAHIRATTMLTRERLYQSLVDAYNPRHEPAFQEHP